MNRKRNKKLSLRFKFYLSISLSTIILSIISAGFSSWIYVNVNSSISNDININTGNIIYNDIFLMSNDDLITFNLGPDGIVEEETIVTKSTISASFQIINNVAYNISNNGNFNFETILECSNKDFITTYISYSNIISNDNNINLNVINITSNKVDNKIINNITLSIAYSGVTKVKLIYNVNDNSNNINTYYSDKPTFNFKLRSK